MTATELPTGPEGLELEMLSETLSSQVPGAALEAFRILDSHLWGSGDASSAGRIDIEVDYTPSSPEDLPRRIVAKIARVDPDDTPERRETRGGLYANEVNVYTRFDPARIVEAPRVLGGTYDPASHHFLLLLEDLRERDVAQVGLSLGRDDRLFERAAGVGGSDRSRARKQPADDARYDPLNTPGNATRKRTAASVRSNVHEQPPLLL